MEKLDYYTPESDYDSKEKLVVDYEIGQISDDEFDHQFELLDQEEKEIQLANEIENKYYSSLGIYEQNPNLNSVQGKASGLKYRKALGELLGKKYRIPITKEEMKQLDKLSYQMRGVKSEQKDREAQFG